MAVMLLVVICETNLMLLVVGFEMVIRIIVYCQTTVIVFLVDFETKVVSLLIKCEMAV